MNRPHGIWIGIILLAGIILLSQCSPYAGKSVLSFFFDGVPEANSTLAGVANSGGEPGDSIAFVEEVMASAGPEHFMHYPYEEKECAACHNEQSLGSMVEPEPGLCYTCHEDLSDRYNYLHGPVAGGYCTSCHDPHISENEHLLRMTGEALCFYCHRKESVLANEMHEGMEGMLCTDCHNPHGGDDKYIFQ